MDWLRVSSTSEVRSCSFPNLQKRSRPSGDHGRSLLGTWAQAASEAAIFTIMKNHGITGKIMIIYDND